MTASPHIQHAIAALEAERADAKQHLAWVEARLAEFHAGPSSTPAPTAPAAPRRRRARQTRSSNGAKAASNGHGNVSMREPIVAYLRDHPGQTAGEVAAALEYKRSSVSTLLTKLAVEGALVKQERGYAAN